MNKYYQILDKILEQGKTQTNKKGNIRYLLNEQLSLSPADLLDIFESHGIARKKLRNELQLFMKGERQVERYREAGINWWDYCGSVLVNSYPTYFEKLPPLLARINREKRNSKNYVLSSVKQEQKAIRVRASAWYNSKLMTENLFCRPTSVAVMQTLAYRPIYTTFILWRGR